MSALRAAPPVDGASERRLFLAASPRDGRADLLEDDVEHATRVLRLGVGDRIVGLDGRGRSWRCAVAAIERRAVRLEGAELVAEEPEPGSAGALDPAITLHVALPRPGPAEELLDRAVQLGVTRFVPLVTERSGPHARELSPGKRERYERILRTALKQSGRLWCPELAEPEAVGVLLARGFTGRAAVLAPRGATTLLAWAGADRSARSFELVVGPEGGFTEAEEQALVARGATACRIARHVLRIETAAEAALALLAAVALERGSLR
ncbi:MAG: 16S rRNA (uracil(1498)-N(3))-methyltransferase [Planctomycetes bacterium]|nr:16S rRNA (uracil(1498)-N(3))-methyltransferase [Planctomycetota bacterium]